MSKGISFQMLVIAGLSVLLALTAMISLAVGSAGISAFAIPGILLAGPGTPEYGIVMDIRLPRLLLGIAMGGALGLAGTLLQGMFKNPLVEPYTLGVSGGASLGVCLNILTGLYTVLGIVAYPLTGFAGASLTIFLVWGLNRNQAAQGRGNRMLLTGVMISYVASSLVMLVMAVASQDDLQNIVLWILGALDESNRSLIYLSLAGSITGLLLSFFFALSLNALMLGEEEAASLGVNTVRVQRGVFLLASFLTGLSVSVAGVIMFVGLIVPHFMRLLLGPDHRLLLPAAWLCGAAFLVLCDVLARTIIAPLELPVGVITGIIGGVVFVWVLATRKEGM